MSSRKNEVRREVSEIEGKEDPDAVSGVLMGFSEEDGLNLERLYEFIDWRKGFLGGYCARTNEPHYPEDFSRMNGMLRRLFGLGYFECKDCGLTLTERRYQRLVEISRFREGLEKSARTLKISVDCDRTMEEDSR